jgi:hypothetical protein
MFIKIKDSFINLDRVRRLEVFHDKDQEAAVIAVHYERTCVEIPFREFAQHEDELMSQLYDTLYRKSLCIEFKPLSQLICAEKI